MRPEHSLRAQLALLGLEPSDIAVVVNTHFHYDHCGENRLFPGNRIVVQRSHYQAALNDPGYPSQYFDRPELSYDLIDGEHELIDGVECLLAPGHAPGLIALLVRLPSGPVLLSGDAIPVAEVIEHGIWAGFPAPTDARVSAARLIERAAYERAPIVYGHDPGQWQQLAKAPTALDARHPGVVGRVAAKAVTN
jgi:N-acyl homoserine lactone hydrolase